jgi:hypothetical protein
MKGQVWTLGVAGEEVTIEHLERVAPESVLSATRLFAKTYRKETRDELHRADQGHAVRH